MIDTLKFPTGEFTHTELAQANGKTNQQVWTAYQAAIKAGTIVSAGLRPNPSGKGKPSKIWKVADGVPVPLVDKVVVVKVDPTEIVSVPADSQPRVPAIINIVELFLEAGYSKSFNKAPILEKASVKLNTLRFLIRLMKDTKSLDNKKYICLQEMIDEIGRMLGGWIRSSNSK